jgi:Protein of unknown function (DUF4236)
MAWNFRMRPSLGPLRFNVSKHGLRSVSLKLGWFTYNFGTGRKSVDTPGPGSVSFGGRVRRNRPRR